MANQIEIGTVFRVKANCYKGKKDIFTVTKIVPEHHADIVCEDGNGDTMCFSSTALETYGINIISQPKFDRALMNLAFSQVLAIFIQTVEGTNKTKYSAVNKAYDVINETDVIFNGSQAIFVSPFSNRKRIVSKNGCHASCDCKGLLSYHVAVFAIYERYTELTTEKNVRAFKPRARQMEKLAA